MSLDKHKFIRVTTEEKPVTSPKISEQTKESVSRQSNFWSGEIEEEVRQSRESIGRRRSRIGRAGL